jgi:anti-sigma regulatory factor (Ser/Thr protein kinase)
MRELALHLLDIAENSVAADAHNISISVIEDTAQDRLTMKVEDDGIGMDDSTLAKVINPFYTSRTTRKVGLGLPFLKQAAEACNGKMQIQSTPGKGTKVMVEFQFSHIDRMPLGDLAATFLSLLVASPDINWNFYYSAIEREFRFESLPVTQLLEGVSLTEPTVLAYLRETIESGIQEIVSNRPLVTNKLVISQEN